MAAALDGGGWRLQNRPASRRARRLYLLSRAISLHFTVNHLGISTTIWRGGITTRLYRGFSTHGRLLAATARHLKVRRRLSCCRHDDGAAVIIVAISCWRSMAHRGSMPSRGMQCKAHQQATSWPRPGISRKPMSAIWLWFR